MSETTPISEDLAAAINNPQSDDEIAEFLSAFWGPGRSRSKDIVDSIFSHATAITTATEGDNA